MSRPIGCEIKPQDLPLGLTVSFRIRPPFVAGRDTIGVFGFPECVRVCVYVRMCLCACVCEGWGGGGGCVITQGLIKNDP